MNAVPLVKIWQNNMEVYQCSLLTVSVMDSSSIELNKHFFFHNRELNYLRTNFRFEKITLFHCMNFR